MKAKTISNILMAVLAYLATTLAQAGPITSTAYLDYTSTAGSSSPMYWGTVTLTQQDTNTVHVLVSLITSDTLFVNTGNNNTHSPFTFQLASGVSGTAAVQNISPGYGASDPYFFWQSGGGNATPFGSFNFAISKTGKNGQAGGLPGPLSFDVYNAGGLAINDFVANSSGYNFAADLYYYPCGSSEQCNGTTGSIAAKTTSYAVPEPSELSVMLFGMALLGGLYLRRRRTV